MIVFPNAKINIGLDIERKRPDGYHDIVTVMVPIGWTDVLEIVPSRSGESSLTVSGRTIDCPPEKNLVMKAYRLMAEQTQLPPVDVYLRKIIPDGAGLGGGSADAAFMLTALDSMFGMQLGDERLMEMASRLGADCPLFIRNEPMLCTGTGTTMEPFPIDLSAYRIAVVKPRAGVSTAEAYAAVTPSVSAVALAERLRCPIESWQETVVNDFEVSVGLRVPEVIAIKRRLREAGAVYASMSGSGSAVYGIFPADKLSDAVVSEFAGCDVWVQPAR